MNEDTWSEEIDTLQRVYESLSRLDRRAQERMLRWLEERLAADHGQKSLTEMPFAEWMELRIKRLEDERPTQMSARATLEIALVQWRAGAKP